MNSLVDGGLTDAVARVLPVNIGVNLLLLGTKAVASLASDSLSLFASALDSALDVLSTAIIWITSRAASGRSRRVSLLSICVAGEAGNS